MGPPQLCKMSVFGPVLEREPGQMMTLALAKQLEPGLEQGQNKMSMLGQPAPEH